MKPKTALRASLIVIAVAYGLAFLGNPYHFAIFVPIAFTVLLLAVVSILAELIAAVIRKRMKEPDEAKPSKLKLGIILWLFFVIVGIWAINCYLLPGLFRPASVAGNIALLVFAALAGWCLIRRKKITLAVSTVVFVIFIVSLWLAGSMTYEPGESGSLKALGTLGYVDWVPAEETIEKAGVTVHDANGACEGVNLFCFRRTSKALLMDNDGKMLHVWVTGGENMTWHHVRLCRNGDLIGGMYLGLLSRLDWYSNIKWVEPMHFHHSIALGENEQIYILDSRFELVFYYGLPVPILNDYAVTMSPDGKIKSRINLYKALKHRMPFEKVFNIFRYSVNPINTYKLIKAA